MLKIKLLQGQKPENIQVDALSLKQFSSKTKNILRNKFSWKYEKKVLSHKMSVSSNKKTTCLPSDNICSDIFPCFSQH